MKKAIHDPEEYTISVRKEVMDGMTLWVSRVAELPDVLEFGDSKEDAYSNTLYTIKVGQEMCVEAGTPFPAPFVFEEKTASGRVTLRLKRSTHAKAIKVAEEEGVSLNSYIASCVENENISKDFKIIIAQMETLKSHMRGLSAEQSVNFTLISSIVKNHVVTMRSKVTFDQVDEEFDHRSVVHRFLTSQDMSYAYD